MKYSIAFMVIGSFAIQYFVMSLLMTNNLQNIKNSLSKFYISAIMGLIMGILEVVMYDFSMMKVSIKYYIPLTILLIIFVVAYRVQFYVLDKDYLREMIEHHSMAIFTSNEILNKTHNYEVTKLAKNIIETQNEEIKKMNDLLLSNKV
jgi:tetrahydromethanopterin S-methyltransferase subunit C